MIFDCKFYMRDKESPAASSGYLGNRLPHEERSQNVAYAHVKIIYQVTAEVDCEFVEFSKQ